MTPFFFFFNSHCLERATAVEAALLGFLTQRGGWTPVRWSSSKSPSLSSNWSRWTRELNWLLQKLSALEKANESLTNWKAQLEVTCTGLDGSAETEDPDMFNDEDTRPWYFRLMSFWWQENATALQSFHWNKKSQSEFSLPIQSCDVRSHQVTQKWNMGEIFIGD